MTNAYLEKANSPVLSVLSLRNFSLSLSLSVRLLFHFLHSINSISLQAFDLPWRELVIAISSFHFLPISSWLLEELEVN